MEKVLTTEKQESKFRETWDVLKKNKAALIGLIIVTFLILLALFGKFIEPFDPLSSIPKDNRQSPNAKHWFGTDIQGRDLFSRVIDGARISMSVGVSAVLISLVLGTILGAISGYRGGKTDTVIMRIMDIVLAIPGILLAIAFMSAFGRGLDKAILAISIGSIPEYARIVRGCVLAEKENDYIQAARIIGNTDLRIIFKHILPNILPSIIVRATLGISGAVLETAALGFLGLGVQPPAAEWGTMLSMARSQMTSHPYMMISPGIAIALTVLGFNLLGDGLRDILDPKSRTK